MDAQKWVREHLLLDAHCDSLILRLRRDDPLDLADADPIYQVDLPRLRKVIGPEPLTVTPGIRPAGSATNDQHRVTTPAMAMEWGADFLVIGRPITQADDPEAAINAIAAGMRNTG